MPPQRAACDMHEWKEGAPLIRYSKPCFTLTRGVCWDEELVPMEKMLTNRQVAPIPMVDTAFMRYLGRHEAEATQTLREAVRVTPPESFAHLLQAAVEHYAHVNVCGANISRQNERARLLAVLRTVCPTVAPYMNPAFTQHKELGRMVGHEDGVVKFSLTSLMRPHVLYALIPRYPVPKEDTSRIVQPFLFAPRFILQWDETWDNFNRQVGIPYPFGDECFDHPARQWYIRFLLTPWYFEWKKHNAGKPELSPA